MGYPSLDCGALISEESRESSGVTSESSEQSEPNVLQQILSQLNNKCDVRLELSDEGKRSKKFCVTRVNKSNSINVDFRLSRGISQALCDAYGENYGSTDFDGLENVRDVILRMTYYWYNFMPLSRGTAVVRFIVFLGLLLAANIEFTGIIPKGLQVDWEAILEFDLSTFVDSVKKRLYPSLKVGTSWKNYPDVTSTFETIGSVVAGLSSYSD